MLVRNKAIPPSASAPSGAFSSWGLPAKLNVTLPSMSRREEKKKEVSF
jgi:hypothetical protein